MSFISRARSVANTVSKGAKSAVQTTQKVAGKAADVVGAGAKSAVQTTQKVAGNVVKGARIADRFVDRFEDKAVNGLKAAGRAVGAGAKSAVQTTQKVAGSVVKGAQKADRFVTNLERGAVKGFKAVGSFLRGTSADRKYDGHLVGAGGKTFKPGTRLSDVPGVTPGKDSKAPRSNETLIYVNGISNTKAQQDKSLQQIADRTGAKVVGIHNSTQGQLRDIIQTTGDKLDKGHNPAVDSLANTVYAELKAGRPVHLMAHSQGGAITSRALRDVANRLRSEDGLSKAQAEKMLGKLKVETFGGASGRYPDGPQYVHYVNRQDKVPSLLGQGNGKGPDELLRHGGKGAVVHRFDQGHGFSGTHGLDDVYLANRVDFDKARAGQFS